MKTIANNKNRILYLLTYLYKFTDQDHQITTGELLEHLHQQDIKCNRMTIKDDVDMLIDAGFDIVINREFSNSFYFNGREFELPELKLLIDAVSSSRFISEKKSEELIQKIANLAGGYQASKLTARIYTGERIKGDNEKVYVIIDTISQAIDLKKRISFQYFDYTPDKEKVFRHDGEVYEVSPYALVWNGDRYYVLAYHEKHDKVIPFRVDRIYRPEISDHEIVPEPADFKVSDYTNKLFKMYDGDVVEVTLECKNDRMKNIIDRFGEDVYTERNSDETFLVKAVVCISPTFYGWLFQYAGEIRIVAPENVRQEYRQRALSIVDN